MSNIPIWLRIVLIYIVLSVLYLNLAWLALQIDTHQKPQLIPVMAKIQQQQQIIYLEVPQTVEQQTTGLMYRTIIPRSRGILFEFTPPQIAEISMQNILVPLDIIFLKNEKILLIKVAVPPCNTSKCPTYSADTFVDMVIELGGLRTLELNLKVGDRLPIQFLTPDTRYSG